MAAPLPPPPPLGGAPNPFDLKGRTEGPVKTHPGRTWTDAEIVEKLQGYLEVTPEHWELVRSGTHVRYYTQKDGYRPGGFVAKNPTDMVPQGTGGEKRFIRLQSGFNERAPGYFSWVVAYEDITRLFIKPDAASLTVQSSLEAAVRGLNENIRKLAEYAKNLGARIAALESDRR